MGELDRMGKLSGVWTLMKRVEEKWSEMLEKRSNRERGRTRRCLWGPKAPARRVP